jgi:CRP-like cAMP-binding protein
MLDKFHQYLSSKVTLTNTEWAQLRDICVFKTLDKGELLLREGEKNTDLFIVVQGYHSQCRG